MRVVFCAMFLIFVGTTLAFGQVPPEVMKAYKAYNQAMTAQDYKAAIGHAKESWEQAEKLLGDSAITGDLAYNYGYVEKNKGQNKKAVAALTRSAELAHLHKEDGALLRLERDVEVISSLEALGKFRPANKHISRAQDFAKAQGLEEDVFFGELLIHESKACNRRLNADARRETLQTGSLINKGSNREGIAKRQGKCSALAERAVSIFEKNPETSRPSYVATAYNFVGYGQELEKRWFDAAMSYQSARQAIEESFGRDHPLTAQIIGRWINARNYLIRANTLQQAEADGLCKCWPFVSERRTIRATKTVKPVFPALAETSGYAIVGYDVSDEGKPVNLKIVHSWPEDFYDSSALEAVSKREYAPKTGAEPQDFRKGLTATMSYYLRQGLEPI